MTGRSGSDSWRCCDRLTEYAKKEWEEFSWERVGKAVETLTLEGINAGVHGSECPDRLVERAEIQGGLKMDKEVIAKAVLETGRG